MNRRMFITRFPAAIAGGMASLATPAHEETTERRELRQLLEQAENRYQQARNLIHWPYRYDETKPLLTAALEDAAQVWLRLRGVRTLERHHGWSFTACNTKDETSGVGWNRAGVACRQLNGHCDHMGRWEREGYSSANVRGNTISRARKELLAALDSVAQCIECTRHSLLGLAGPLPLIPPGHL